MKRIWLILLVSAVALLIDRRAEAQRRIPHYQRTPTISPYINLFRADNGGLNSFVGNYQPSQRLRQFVDETNREFYFQQQATRQEAIRLSQEIAVATQQDAEAQQGLILRPTSTAGSIPRTAGGFLQYSQYFPNSTTAGGGGITYGGRAGGRRVPMARGGIGMGGGYGLGGGLGGYGMGGIGGGIGGLAR